MEEHLEWLAKAVPKLPDNQYKHNSIYHFPHQPHLSPDDHPHVKRFKEMMDDNETRTPSRGDVTHGVSPKTVVRDPANSTTYLVKPYHDLSGYASMGGGGGVPGGWGEKLYQRICKHVGLSDMCQESHIIEDHYQNPHILIPLVKGPVGSQRAMTKTEFMALPSSERRQKLHPMATYRGMQMAFLDYVMGNRDRHTGNILMVPHEPNSDKLMPMAIDNSITGAVYRSEGAEDIPDMSDYLHNQVHVPSQDYEDPTFHEELANWWKTAKPQVKNAITEHLETGGDPATGYIHLPHDETNRRMPYDELLHEFVAKRSRRLDTWANQILNGSLGIPPMVALRNLR